MIKKNLFYQICPLTINNQWRFNLECLSPFLNVFNGRILITIKTGDLMAAPDEIHRYFLGLKNVEYIYFKNDPKLGEAESFIQGIHTLESDHLNELTFYAHTKGISPKYLPEDLISINRWVKALYDYNLSNIAFIEKHIQKYAFFGSFKRHEIFKNIPTSWHYSGSFYWFRHDVMYSNLKKINLANSENYYLSEMLPGLLAPSKQAYCFFDDYARDVYEYTDKEWALILKQPVSFKLSRRLHTLKRKIFPS